MREVCLPVFNEEELSLDVLFSPHTWLHGVHVPFRVLLVALEMAPWGGWREDGGRTSLASRLQ